MDSELPPPYAARSNLSDEEQFFDELPPTVQHQIPDPRLDRETERLRSFLQFATRHDYDHGPAARLHAGDRGHFAKMHNILRKMKYMKFEPAQKAEL